eukprot:TRINITY_DN854_c0_g1_i1.p1 TRINITY_DN854_c0_g1~~TRINITY_DN854_c0_g1_i1.p1  ORF type:complete len:146 (-),score=20.89 TRINITY_DN854_c0_g1_i1:122-559(-)
MTQQTDPFDIPALNPVINDDATYLGNDAPAWVHQLHDTFNSLQQNLNTTMQNFGTRSYNRFRQDVFEPLIVTNSGGTGTIGAVPSLITNGGLFPATQVELELMNVDQIQNLSDFYNEGMGITFGSGGDNIAVMREKVLKWIHFGH